MKQVPKSGNRQPAVISRTYLNSAHLPPPVQTRFYKIDAQNPPHGDQIPRRDG